MSPAMTSGLCDDGRFDHDQLGRIGEERIGRSEAGPLRVEDHGMDDESTLRQLSHDIADAIGKRDVDALAVVLAPGFNHHGDEGVTSGATAFLEGVRGIPGEIVFVRLERLDVAISANAAMATGIQHAHVIVDGQAIHDRRVFADFFVKT